MNISTPTGTTAGPDNLPPIERASLVERCMSDAGFACVILGKFQARAGEMVAAVERAVAAADAAAIGRAAHALKGASANLSAERLRAAAQAVESAAHDGDPAAAGPLLTDLRLQLARCLAYVPVLVTELRRATAA